MTRACFLAYICSLSQMVHMVWWLVQGVWAVRLQNGFYLVECAWCKRHLRWKRTEGTVPGETSHSICPRCAADVLSTLPPAHSPAPQQEVPDTRETAASTPPPAT